MPLNAFLYYWLTLARVLFGPWCIAVRYRAVMSVKYWRRTNRRFYAVTKWLRWWNLMELIQIWWSWFKCDRHDRLNVLVQSPFKWFKGPSLSKHSPLADSQMDMRKLMPWKCKILHLVSCHVSIYFQCKNSSLCIVSIWFINKHSKFWVAVMFC